MKTRNEFGRRYGKAIAEEAFNTRCEKQTRRCLKNEFRQQLKKLAVKEGSNQ